MQSSLAAPDEKEPTEAKVQLAGEMRPESQGLLRSQSGKDAIWTRKISKLAARQKLYEQAKQGDCKEIMSCLEHFSDCEKSHFKWVCENALYQSTYAPTPDAFLLLQQLKDDIEYGECKYAKNEKYNNFSSDKPTGIFKKNQSNILITRVALAPWRDRRKKISILESLLVAGLGYLHPIVIAIISDDIVSLERCWSQQPHFPFISEKGITPLQFATANDSRTCVEWLLEQGSTVSEKENYYGSTPFLFATQNSHLLMCQYLVIRGAKASEKNNCGQTALFFAAKNGDLPLLQWLVSSEVNVNEHAKDQTTALHFAAHNNQLSAVQFLMEQNANIHAKSASGRSVLDYAVMGASLDVVKWIVSKKSQLRITLNYVEIIMLIKNYLASYSFKHFKLAEYFLKRHIELFVNTTDNETKRNLEDALQCVVNSANQFGRFDVFKMLIERKIMTVLTLSSWPQGLPTVSPSLTSVLAASAEIGHLPMLRTAVQWASPGTSSIPLNINAEIRVATQYGYEGMVRFLVESGANIEEKTADGRTAFLHAVENGHLRIAKYLFEQKNSVLDQHTNNDQSALHLAAYNGHLEVIQWLVECGIKIGARDDRKKCVIDFAGMKKHLAIVQWVIHWILTHRRELINLLGRRALYWSAKLGDRELTSLLISHGVRVTTAVRDSIAFSSPALVTNQYDYELVPTPRRTHETLPVMLPLPTEPTDVMDVPIFGAIENGDTELVREWLGDEASPEDTLKAFHHAVQYGQLDVARSLFSYGEQLTEFNQSHYTALGLAAAHGHIPMLQWLIEVGGNLQIPAHESGMTTFLCAVHAGRLCIVQWLLRNGAVKTDSTRDGRNAIFIATAEKNVSMLQLLFAHNVPLSRAENGLTPLFFALKKLSKPRGSQNAKMVWQTAHLFIAYNVDLNEQCQEAHQCSKECGCGYTIMHYAARYSNTATLQWLAQKGARYDVRSSAANGAYMPIHSAALVRNLSNIRYLAQHLDTPLQARDGEGNTLLLLVAQQEYGPKLSGLNNFLRLNFLRWLLAHGSMLEEKNSAGETVIDILLRKYIEEPILSGISYSMKDNDYLYDIIELLKEHQSICPQYKDKVLLKLCEKRKCSPGIDGAHLPWLLESDSREEKIPSGSTQDFRIKAFIISISCGDARIVALFLKNFACREWLEWRDLGTGENILHAAVKGMSREVVEGLLSYGVPLRLIIARDNSGKTALDYLLESFIKADPIIEIQGAERRRQRQANPSDLMRSHTKSNYHRSIDEKNSSVTENAIIIKSTIELLLKKLLEEKLPISVSATILKKLRSCNDKKPYHLIQETCTNQLRVLLYPLKHLTPVLLWDTVVDYVGNHDDPESQSEQLALLFRYISRFSERPRGRSLSSPVDHALHWGCEESLPWFPHSLSWKGQVTDRAGRNFSSITPFQYGLWTCDFTFVRKASKHMLLSTQREQLMELEIKGTEHGVYICFDALCESIVTYIKGWRLLSSDERRDRWRTIAGMLCNNFISISNYDSSAFYRDFRISFTSQVTSFLLVEATQTEAQAVHDAVLRLEASLHQEFSEYKQALLTSEDNIAHYLVT